MENDTTTSNSPLRDQQRTRYPQPPAKPTHSIENPHSDEHLSIQLYTDGGFVAVSNGSRLVADSDAGVHLYRSQGKALDWTPPLSGRRGRIVLLMVSATTVLVYITICKNIKTRSLWTTYIPSFLALVLATVCNRSISDESDWVQWQPKSEVHTGQLFRLKAAIILFLCPIMSMPILPGYDYYHEREPLHNVFGAAQTVLRPSWERVAGNLMELPPLLSQPTNRSSFDPRLPETRMDPTDSFSIAYSDFEDRMLISDQEELVRTVPSPMLWEVCAERDICFQDWSGYHGQDDDKMSNWNLVSNYQDVFDGDYVLLPFMPTLRDNFATAYDQESTANADVLAISMHCTLYDAKSQEVSLSIEKDRSIRISHLDEYGCKTNLELQSRRLSSTLRDLTASELDKYIPIFKYDELANGNETYAEYWQKMRDILSNSQMFLPKWVAGEATGIGKPQHCKRYLYFAGVDPPIVREPWDDSITGNVRVQKCSITYHKAELLLSVKGRWVLQGGLPTIADIRVRAPSWPASATPRWHRVSNKVEEALAIFWHRELAKATIFDETWPLGLLRHHYFKMANEYWDKPNRELQFPFERFGARLLGNFMSQTLSAAVGLTIQECLYDHKLQGFCTSSETTEGTYEASQWRITVPLSHPGLAVLPLLFAIPLLALVLYDFLIGIGMNIQINQERECGLPWSLSTIAGKAALLCRSRLPSHFKMLSSSPASIFSQKNLRIGLFSDPNNHNVFTWKLDSLNGYTSLDMENLEENQQRQSHALTKNLWLSRLFGLFSLLTLFSVFLWAFSGDGTRLIYTNDSHHWFPLPFEGQVIGDISVILKIWYLPLVAVYALTWFWLDDLRRFYCISQPWAALREPQIAIRSLTVDYSTWKTPFTSLRLRHWAVFLLSVTTMVSLALPFLIAGTYSMSQKAVKTNTFQVIQADSWPSRELNASMGHLVETALAKSLQGLNMPTTLPTLVNGSHAFLDVELAAEDFKKGRRWWIPSEARRAELVCKPVTQRVSYHAPTSGLSLTKKTFSVASIDVFFEDLGDERQRLSIKDPCRAGHISSEGVSAVDSMSAVCGRWSFIDSNGSASPQWILTWIHGPSKRRQDEIVFVQEPVAIALECAPHYYESNGVLSVIREKSGGYYIQSYENVTEVEFDKNEASVFSGLLNASILNPSSAEGALILPHPVIATRKFVGDTLAFMLYRHGWLRHKHPGNIEELQDSSSHVFSTIFAMLAYGMQDLEGSSRTVPVTLFVLRQIFEIRWHVAYVLFAILGGIVIISLALGFPREKYWFPVDVTTLEGALWLLAPGTIPDLIEKIEKPEELTREQFHRRVEGFGHRYQLGIVNGRWMVDRAERFEDDEPVFHDDDLPEYRDDPDYLPYRDEPGMPAYELSNLRLR